MGERVNFNKSNRKKVNKKYIGMILLAIIIIIFLVYGFIMAYKNVKNNNVTATLKFQVEDYNSLEELLYKYNCIYLRESEEDGLVKIYVNFDRNLYSNGKSNENRFMKIIKLVAEYEKFKKFELLDTSRNIDIIVDCDGKYINSISINGDFNYFANKDSEINVNKTETQVVPFSVQSPELQELINNNWIDLIDWGTKDSTCDGYNIYFDEGIKYKKVAGKVFNVIYTTKYDAEVVDGLRPGSTEEEIKKALGNPSFEKDDILLGYLGDNNYLFFDLLNNQVSIYPVKKIENEMDFKELISKMNETNDVKTFIKDLTGLYLDYDIYDYDEDYVKLQYTLLGIEVNIAVTSLKSGINLYQNYSGNFNISNLDNVYVKENDLVFEYELNRSMNYNMQKVETGDTSTLESGDFSNAFALYSRSQLASGEIGLKGPTFLSKNEEYADTELDRTLLVSSYKWYDDYNFVYSINFDGIYVYNCQTRVNAKIADVDDEIIINSIEEKKILYNKNIELYVDIK